MPDRSEKQIPAVQRAEESTEAERMARVERMRQCADDGKSEARLSQARRGRYAEGADAAPHGEGPRDQSGTDGRKRRDSLPPRNADMDCNQAAPPYDDERHRYRGGRFRRRFMRRLTTTAIVLLLLIAAILIFWPRVQQALTPSFAITVPDSLSGLLPDETMGYNAVDFCNAILGESREKKSLVVMEQDVEVTSQISQDLLNISLFSKQKVIHSFGTGVYTVDLSALTESDIAVDEASQMITVTIPHAKLTYVSVDVDKTVFEDTKKAFLAVGDIKLSTEQKHVLDTSVDTALRERLNDPALFIKADEIALVKARELFSAPVSALAAQYIVKVVMAQESAE